MYLCLLERRIYIKLNITIVCLNHHSDREKMIFIIIQHLFPRRSDVGHMLSSVRGKLSFNTLGEYVFPWSQIFYHTMQISSFIFKFCHNFLLKITRARFVLLFLGQDIFKNIW